MTYKESIKQLREEAAKACNEYLKAEEALFEEGKSTILLDKSFNNLQKLYKEWQHMQNEVNKILSFVSKNKIDLNSELTSYK
jgi:uncharacterized protein YaaN involved in tellurite resistance